VKIMVDADLAAAHLVPRGEGERILLDKGIHWTKSKQMSVG